MAKIGNILKEKGLVSSADLDQAGKIEKQSGKFLGQILIDMGKITEKDLLTALSEQTGVPMVSLQNLSIAPAVLEKLPVKYVWHYKVLPLKFDNNVLHVALSDPSNLWALEDIKQKLRVNVEPHLAPTAEIEEAIRKYYGVGADTIEKILSKEDDKKKTTEVTHKRDVQDIEKLAGDASVIRLVNEIIKEAIESRATDIHFEMYQNELVVRYRIDGVLQPTKISDDVKFLYQAIIARIKVICGLDIVERRLPQGGSARIRLGENEYDLRVSVIPDNYSEGVVIRVLPAQMLTELPELGMPAKEMARLEELIHRSYGIIYVTGPTGSGKSTTLYACLTKLNKPEVKIITVEDPVEYKLKYVEQIQVNVKVGLTFSSVLRSVLRHDPDIIMVGEVRDAETAQIAVQASLTGHLVLSTLHTNDAPSAVTRLIDMGVEPFLVASSVLAIVAQRLVRRVCMHCRKETLWDGKKVYQAVGCEKCRMTGYQGRMAIYEMLPISDKIHEMIMKKASAAEIRQVAVSEGMKSLFEAGMDKVKEGLTTPEEILRVVQER